MPLRIVPPHSGRPLAVAVLSLLLPFLCAAGGSTTSPAFEERVEAQRAVEQVYWNHRLWPKENPGPKPPFGQFVPESVIRSKVEEGLRKSAALEKFWNRSIQPDQLQAEMNRMAERTQNPAMLRELFAALHDDPALIAETIARPALAERWLRDWYSSDPRFHGELQRRAAGARADCTDVGCMKSMGGEYRETTWSLRPADVGRKALVRDDVGRLDPEEWQALRGRLAGLVGGRPDDLAVSALSRVEETPEALTVVAVLHQGKERIRTATVTWPKTTFDSWWDEERAAVAASIPPTEAEYSLPGIDLAGCTPGTWTPTRYDLPPSARADATSVWTGAELLVWGGDSASAESRQGGRYNPAIDAWTPLSWKGSAPFRLYGHTAVWTGTEMIVWGGWDGDENSTTRAGGRYNPSTDSWTATSIGVNVPSARSAHSAVWTGSQMIVWGGEISFSPTNSGGRYNPSTDTWVATSTANAPSPREGHVAVWTGSLMLVWGGTSDGSGGRYDPLTGAWTTMASNAPAGRSGFSAVWSGSALIIWGGAAPALPQTVLNTGGRYDPAANAWTAISTVAAPQARSGHSAVWTGSEMIVWGGVCYPSSTLEYLGTGGRYNPSSDTWTATAPGPTARSRHVAAWTGNEMIVWGGLTVLDTNTATGSRYRPGTNSWAPTSMGTAIPAARWAHKAVWTGAEMIVWGGELGTGEQINTGGRYDPATDSWAATSTGTGVPSVREGGHILWTGSRMIVWGGRDSPNNELNSGSRYDPVTDTWAAMSTGTNVPAPRYDAEAVWSGTRMIVWGGYDRYCVDVVCGVTFFNTGASYAPSTDTWLPTSTGANVPSPRSSAMSTWTGSRMIIYGGLDDLTYFGNGAIYDPAADTWQPIAASTPRAQADSVWSGTEMILYGGKDALHTFFGGVRYSPAADAWQPVSGTQAPRCKTPSSVWTGSSMILWGGYNDTGSIIGTGARYDPAADAWTAIASGADAPYPRANHSAVWDGSGMIVWGGELSQPELTATGARYCACVGGGPFYRDQDGDGYGDAAVSVTPCDGVAPSGYLPMAGDCNDANPTMHPGAFELCDGLDNDCDTFLDNSVLPPIATVAWNGSNLAWTPQAQAWGYDIVWGSLNTLRSTGGNFTTATISCYGNDTELYDLPFPAVPGVGDGYWILVRGENCGGPASYDGEGPGQVGSRDAEIAAAPNHCP